MEILVRQALILLQPLALFWCGLLLLSIFLWRQRQRKLCLWSVALAGFFYIATGTGLPGAILRTLERPWAGCDLAALPACDAVVMLGGCTTPSKYEAAQLHLTRAGDRVVMALEIMRRGKAPALVLGGAAAELDEQPVAEADLLKRWLEEWLAATPGTQAREILSLGGCANTRDEAMRTRKLADERGWKRILLVTSAAHMRRAEATFRTAGLDVVPVPCNFMTNVSTPDSPFTLSLPHHSQLDKLSIWLYETVGWWEYRRQGWIKPEALGKKPAETPPPVATFSIVAADPATGELGVAVASRVPAVGAIVPWARAGSGAIATQAWANPTYGPRGLDLLRDGVSAEEAIRQLTKGDESSAERQVGLITAAGDAATFTGDACIKWAGGRTGKHFAVQGNILTGPEVIDAMAEAFTAAEGELSDRLLTALVAGDAAGGDKRGRQSAALVVVREGWGYGGLNDRYRDLRVDDHPAPVGELRRLLEIHRGVFRRP